MAKDIRIYIKRDTTGKLLQLALTSTGRLAWRCNFNEREQGALTVKQCPMDKLSNEIIEDGWAIPTERFGIGEANERAVLYLVSNLASGDGIAQQTRYYPPHADRKDVAESALLICTMLGVTPPGTDDKILQEWLIPWDGVWRRPNGKWF
jgi:hypothetical protein